MDIERIKHETDIVEIVGKFVDLKKSGNSHKGFCPFHNNTKSPAFVVWENSKTWKCFAGCGGGDVIDFVARIEGVSTGDAIRKLAGGVSPSPRGGGANRQPRKPKQMTDKTPPRKLARVGGRHRCSVSQNLVHPRRPTGAPMAA